VPELRQKLPAMVRTAADRKPYVSAEGKLVSAGEDLIVRPTARTSFSCSSMTSPRISWTACGQPPSL